MGNKVSKGSEKEGKKPKRKDSGANKPEKRDKSKKEKGAEAGNDRREDITAEAVEKGVDSDREDSEGDGEAPKVEKEAATKPQGEDSKPKPKKKKRVGFAVVEPTREEKEDKMKEVWEEALDTPGVGDKEVEDLTASVVTAVVAEREKFKEKMASGDPNSVSNTSMSIHFVREFVPDIEENVKFPVGQTVSYDHIEPLLQTGDLILMQGAAIGSKVISMATKSMFSHVGLVIRIPKLDVAFVWESAPNLQKISDVEEMVPKKGVALVDLRTKLATLKAVSVRKLRGKRSPALMRELLRFRQEVKDVPYEKNMIEFVKAAKSGNSREDLSSIFCSELVAEAYKRMKILISDAPSNDFNPNDFSDRALHPEKLVFAEGYYLEKETILDMEDFKLDAVTLEEVDNVVRQRKKKRSSNYKDFNEVERTLRTGDLVLFKSKKLTGVPVDYFAGAKWTHVGIVIKMSVKDESLRSDKAKDEIQKSTDENFITLVFESSLNHGNISDIQDGKVKRGVQLVSFREKFVCGSYDKCAVRRLNVERTSEMLKSLRALRNEVKDRPYEARTLEILKARFDWLSILGENKADLSTIFCSELVAEAYQRMGLLPAHPPANEYTPMDFANEMKLLKDAELEPPVKLFVDV